MSFPLNREISHRVTPWLAKLRLSPNQVTGLSLCAGMVAAWNFFQGGPSHWLVGALWLQVSYILDNCDGELARMTGRSSGFGSWLDTIVDCIIHMAFFYSLGMGMYRHHPNPLWVRLSFIAVGGVFLTYLTYVLEQVQLRGKSAWVHPDPPNGSEGLRFWGKLRKVFREDFSFVVLGSALAQHVSWLLWSGIFGSFFIGFSSMLAIAVRGKRLLAGFDRSRR